MPAIRHALTGAMYDLGEDGAVVVEMDGRTGRFDRDGGWLDGEIRSADPELCRWVFDPRGVSRHRQVLDDQAQSSPPQSSTTGDQR